jgi:hypothetical protein
VEKHGAAGPATDENTTRRMRIECWMTRATNTHSEYVILNAFPWQAWLHESASVPRLYVCSLSGVKRSHEAVQDLHLYTTLLKPDELV